MGYTDDPNDPDLDVIVEDNKRAKYLVLSEEERAKGYVRPLRSAYVHVRCGVRTIMGDAIAETYARDPYFYGQTYCAECRDHFPVGEHGEFVWVDGIHSTNVKVGT